jgi:GrpB-like predicted nucleotidyltransferase (UPF0157 family)/GNAT superfamily N-acetyltransferase
MSTPGRAATDLKRHPSLDDRFDPAVRIVDYDATWPAAAAEELRRVKQALGNVAVRLEHVGSTAVPGLAAKPIVDLQLSVAALEPRAAYVEPLEALGYLFAPAPESPDFHFFGKPPERPRSHHLHVCKAGSDHERRHLAVRDYLRAHDDEAATYAALKRDVASRHPQDRLAYIEGKEQFVTALEARALQWARGIAIREATPEDWAAIWPFLREIVVAGETFAYDPEMSEDQARELWMVGAPGRTVVAVDEDGTVLGTANMYANRPGPGAHVASASFMVDPHRGGRGVGRALGEHAIAWARSEGFRAMQFNAVVETNTRAVGLWRSLGFEVLATVPEAFRHPALGYVGLHLMYRRL